MRPAAFVAALALAAAAPAAAQLQPIPGPGDPRIQLVDYDGDQVVQLQVSAGYALSIEFAPDERIENVAIGDGAAWQVTPNKRGDHLFIKVVQAGPSTNMMVVTDARTYTFELAPLYGPQPNMAYIVRFRYPAAVATVAETAPAEPPGRWRMRGSRQLRPKLIEDDGVKTYLSWPSERTLPAVFTLDSLGKETLVDGAMRDDRFVIDGVVRRLIFRLDKHVAYADRRPARGQP